MYKLNSWTVSKKHLFLCMMTLQAYYYSWWHFTICLIGQSLEPAASHKGGMDVPAGAGRRCTRCSYCLFCSCSCWCSSFWSCSSSCSNLRYLLPISISRNASGLLTRFHLISGRRSHNHKSYKYKLNFYRMLKSWCWQVQADWTRYQVITSHLARYLPTVTATPPPPSPSPAPPALLIRGLLQITPCGYIS